MPCEAIICYDFIKSIILKFPLKKYYFGLIHQNLTVIHYYHQYISPNIKYIVNYTFVLNFNNFKLFF